MDVFEDYFRMRGADVRAKTPAELTGQPGFFRFGEAGVCFGRVDGLPVAPTADSALSNATARTDNGVLGLPFDPTEVAGLLRDESYVPPDTDAASSAAKRLVRSAYYLVRPVLPVEIRRHLQRRALADWKMIPFPGWPLDCSVDVFLREVLVQLLRHGNGRPVPFIWFWPEGKSACAILTHDVETDAGQRFCPDLMGMNEEFGFRAAFQFVPETRYARRENVHADVRARGHEINVHGLNHDGRLFVERTEFLRRAEKINAYAKSWGALGFRSPVLYRRQAWFSALDFDYDMSVPNTARLEAQRGGCCTVMPYFIGNLVELPTTAVEDYTLLHILRDPSTDVWRRQLDTIASLNGIFNLIVHPDYLDTPRARAMYRTFLGELRARVDSSGIWAPLPRDAAAWWRARSRMSLVGEGDQLRIEGDPAGRARIAHARLDGDRLVFELAKPNRVARSLA